MVTTMMVESEIRELQDRLLQLADAYRAEVKILVDLHKNRDISEFNRDLIRAKILVKEGAKDGRINGPNAEMRMAQLAVILSDDKDHCKWNAMHMSDNARYKEAELLLQAIRLEAKNLRILLGGIENGEEI